MVRWCLSGAAELDTSPWFPPNGKQRGPGRLRRKRRTLDNLGQETEFDLVGGQKFLWNQIFRQDTAST